ncbi:hypothetical protein OHO28_29345 [Streptomyces europaeiscabiei]
MLELQHTEDPVASPANRMFEERHNTLKDRTKTFVGADSAHVNGTSGHQ